MVAIKTKVGCLKQKRGEQLTYGCIIDSNEIFIL